MKIEQQVVSLELAKKLKVAGYPQVGYCWWIQDRKGTIGVYDATMVSDYMGNHDKIICIAPTVAELGEKLPIRIYPEGVAHYFFTYKTWHDWHCSYGFGLFDDDKVSITHAPTEADARAKMWLYLKEKGLL